MVEEYRVIKGFENYSVSNFGNVKNKKTGRILKPGINSNGYYQVRLYDNDGKYFHKYIHKLVSEYFIANPYNKTCVDHIDKNHLNNDIDNLRWVTYQENNMNKKLSSKNTSYHKGISFHKPSKQWCARIQINGKKKHLGYFDKIEDAVNCRVKKAKRKFTNSCEKEINININIPANTKVNLNIDIKSQEEQELEDLEREFNDILNTK